ncbi:MAG: caspase family protein [Acidobacteriota bacterium]
MKAQIFSLILLIACIGMTASAQPTRQLERERTGASAVSQKRLALVIGNGGYKFVGPLANPVNDASDMAATLRKLGFEVISGTDQNKRQMETLIRQFGERLSDTKAVGLFYYAGHGFQSSGQNFLAPVDADIPAEDEIEYAAVNLNFVLNKMAVAGNPLNIVILDACRNNPFAKKWRSVRDISTQGGLAGITKAPTGTMIAYSTAPGEVASDGGGRNGLYTGELLKQIAKPDTSLEDVFKNVRSEVRRKSESKQVPWESSSVEGDFYFAGAVTASALGGRVPSTSPSVNLPAASTGGSRNLTKVERWQQMSFRGEDMALVAETTAEIKANPDNFAAYWLRTVAIDPIQETDRDEQDARAVLKLLATPKTAEEYTARCFVQKFLPKAEKEKQDWCAKAIEVDPKYAPAYYTRGLDGSNERARRILDYTKAIELEPSNAAYYIARGQVFISAGEKESGLADLTKAIQVDPSRAKSYIAIANFYKNREKDYIQALANYDKAIESDPRSAEAYLARAYYYHERDQILKSDLDFYKALELAPKLSAYYFRTRSSWNTYGDKPNYEKALTDIGKAVEADPVRYTSARADIYFKKGEFQSAVDDYSRAISLDPKYHYGYIARGDAYIKLNDITKALADYDKYAELEPDSTYPYSSRASYYKDKGDFPRAIAEYTRAIALQPKYGWLYYERGEIYRKNLADLDKAIADHTKAIELSPDASNYHNVRGIAYDDKKEYAKAIVDFTKAIELNPKSSVLWNNRANCYERMGNTAAAAADRAKAAELK